MTPRNNVVRLRLTEAEREAWAKAAGGKGKLSEWIRAVCNTASVPGLQVTATPKDSGDVCPPSGSASTHSTPGPSPETNSGRGEAARGDDPAQQTPDPEKIIVSREKALANSTKLQPSKCARWMHHRTGVYCGTCKKVN